MRNHRSAAVAVFVASLLAAVSLQSHVSVADGPTASASEPVATFRVIHDPSGDVITGCDGVDGRYVDEQGHSAGTITSSDPRLNGTYVLEQHAFINVSTHTGWVIADAEIRDPQTGEVTFTGTVYGALKGVAIRGVMVGETSSGDTMVLNATAYHDPNTSGPHAVTGTIGGPSSFPIDLASITTPC